LISNSTLAANVVFDGQGGGLANGVSNAGTATILHSTIADNRASGAGFPNTGGGIANFSDSTVTLLNTILARNARSSPFPFPVFGSPDCAGPVTSLGNNVVGDPTGCTITLQRSDLTGDPGLDAFTDDGTPGHGHFPLLPTSQAIDAGNDAVCLRTDQLGQRRIGPCDIGAIRFLDHADLLEEDDAVAALQATK
jgi:hypothetical protein